jgi:NADH:ubiquinone oxidoreductase subunit F (NADH-binding)
VIAGALPHPSAWPAPGTARGGQDLPRLLPADGAPADLRAHTELHGPLPRLPGRELIAETEAAGLTGRGGAAFPTYRKLAGVASHGVPPVVIGNGAEGEPASSKDSTLLRVSPHLVLDGLQLAARAVGSRAVGLYVHRDAAVHRRLNAALDERARLGTDGVPVELITAPPRFLAGEESAVTSRAEGGPALPRFKPPRMSQRGVAQRPTLVQNVETLAHLALIARYGADWFRAVGLPGEPGSMLTTVHRADGTVVVSEVPIGVPLAALLGAGAMQAVLVGGYHGAWLPGGLAAGLALSNESLRPHGAAVGAGVIAVLPADRCPLVETARVVRYLALESAGQCGPCVNGLPRIAAGLAQIASAHSRPHVLADIERWSHLVERRGACHHPDGTVRLVRSALAAFTAELGRHPRGECTAASRAPFLPLPHEPALDEADWR